jgi:hypothetical protein
MCEDGVSASEQLSFPRGQQLFTELMLTTNLGCVLSSGQCLGDDEGLEFRFESSTFCHLRIPLTRLYAADQKLSSFWIPLQNSNCNDEKPNKIDSSPDHLQKTSALSLATRSTQSENDAIK